MKILTIVLLMAVLLMAIAMSSARAQTDIAITITEHDIVSEKISIDYGPESYDYFEFETPIQPLSIIYDPGYDILSNGSSYTIKLKSPAIAGKIEFTVLYDELIDTTSSGKVFRTGFSELNANPLSVTLELPEGAFLSGNPGTVPEADSITTDGRTIKLGWLFDRQDSGITVFYDKDSNSIWWYIIPLIIVLAIACILFFYSRKNVRKIVSDTLSEDEKAVVGLLRTGVTKQKEIAVQLSYSKSKMSKVLRKLEEKGLIEKTPHFKTNIIKLKKIK